jgi:adenylate cyclase
LALGLAIGAIGVLLSLVPTLASLEDSLGLGALFRLRGPVDSPPGVVVVSIDESASARLNLPTAVREWPRSYHARLIDRLVVQGAAAIVFDLQFFRDGVDADDEELATAIARSKRVVLVQLLERVPGSAQEISRWQNPIPAFAAAAAGLAPVPIPDTPLVSWFWTFVTTAGGDEVPTLPAVALQVVAGQAITALSVGELEIPPPPASGASELLAYMRDVRRRFKQNPSVVPRALVRLAMKQRIDDRDRQLARRLAALYRRDAASYLNFYGPPGSVCTVPYEVVHEGQPSPCPLKGATVFVGVGKSRLDRAEQIDTYHTVYERADGVDLSGVELHATAFANLLAGTALHPVGPTAAFLILVGTGVVLGGATYWRRTRLRYGRGAISARLEAAAAAVLLAGAYGVIVYLLFAVFHVVVPIVIPLAVQLPAALIVGLLVRPVIHEEQVHAVCLVTDATGSTAVGQRLSHGAYAKLMTEYNRVLAECVAARGGLALAPHGDGFVSLWVVEPGVGVDDSRVRLAACHTALEMLSATRGFNERHAEGERLPVRIGMNVGPVTIRSDADRGAFEAVGDTVNVAARLQQANKELGTSVLASAPLVQDLSPELPLRRVDSPPALKGVANPPEVFEVLASRTFGQSIVSR